MTDDDNTGAAILAALRERRKVIETEMGRFMDDEKHRLIYGEEPAMYSTEEMDLHFPVPAADLVVDSTPRSGPGFLGEPEAGNQFSEWTGLTASTSKWPPTKAEWAEFREQVFNPAPEPEPVWVFHSEEHKAQAIADLKASLKEESPITSNRDWLARVATVKKP